MDSQERRSEEKTGQNDFDQLNVLLPKQRRDSLNRLPLFLFIAIGVRVFKRIVVH